MPRLPVVIASALLLASGPLSAQQVAITQAKPECPPGEPDSLQISWSKPCDSGTWLFDTQLGCRMWDWHPEHGRPIDRFSGVYRNGKREGPGHYVWNDSVRFDGTYANDVPQGYGVAEIEGERLAGEWNKGCLASGDKVVAIGVPRLSCGPAGKPNLANR
jgi:hypothetical protein